MEKKNVLIVEDNGAVFNMLKDELDESQFNVERARAVDEAIGYFEDDSTFDCCIVDLQIQAFGLTIEEMDEYQDREGYALLKNYLWKEGKIKKSQTIICSRYISLFIKEYRKEIEELKGEGLKLVEKVKEFEKEVFLLINEICR